MYPRYKKKKCYFLVFNTRLIVIAFEHNMEGSGGTKENTKKRVTSVCKKK
jgi:hypothetical protein